MLSHQSEMNYLNVCLKIYTIEVGTVYYVNFNYNIYIQIYNIHS